jgi:mannose-1-phosphate guanylyltransferase
MRALVLAAGVGSRLRPYTDRCPKPMLNVGGDPILSYNLVMLADAGIRDVVVNLHYLPEVVREHVGDGSAWGLHVTYSEEPTLRGTAGALVPFAESFRSGTFVIVFGDNLLDIDLVAMSAAHQSHRAVATLAVYSRDDVTQSGVAELGENDRVDRFVEKPRPGETTSHWVNAGVVIAEPALLDYVPSDGASDLGRDVLPAVQARGGLYAYRMSGGLWWFDRAEDYRAALADPELAAFTANRHRGRGAQSSAG